MSTSTIDGPLLTAEEAEACRAEFADALATIRRDPTASDARALAMLAQAIHASTAEALAGAAEEVGDPRAFDAMARAAAEMAGEHRRIAAEVVAANPRSTS